MQLPPGDKLPSISRTERMRRDPLSVLLAAYEEHGPIFAIRIFHAIHVFMLGPEANRFILVTDRDKFRWRDGSLGDLIPLIGDGLLTTDGEYHDRAREIMLPVFHRERIARRRGRDERGGRAGARGLAARRCRWTSTTGPATWRCGSRCAPCSGSIPIGPASTSRPRSSAGSPSMSASTSSRCCAARAARSHGCGECDGRSTGSSSARSPAAAASGDAGEDILGLLIEAEDADGQPLHRRAGSRPDPDAAVRRPRHDHLDRRLPLLRARPPPGVGERLADERDRVAGR